MDAMREKLKEFYMKQHTTMLSVRKTASNCLLVEKRDGKKAILARFNIALLGAGHAWNIAMVAMSTLAYERAKEEMLKFEVDQDIAFNPPIPVANAEGIVVVSGKVKTIQQEATAAKPNPLGDLFDMGRTASDAKPLE